MPEKVWSNDVMAKSMAETVENVQVYKGYLVWRCIPGHSGRAVMLFPLGERGK
jgi:hypothetical protein